MGSVEHRSGLLEGDDGMLEVLVAGEGPAVVMIPSLGRGADDFADLAGRLAAAGYAALRPQPRGLGRSTASGNRVARMTATLHGDLVAVRTAFFAPGSDASVWFEGWNGLVAAVQSKANARTSVERWWEAGSAEVLVAQPLDDVIAPPGNATQIVEAIGDRASMVTVADAGHALLPEQPDTVAPILLDWLAARRG